MNNHEKVSGGQGTSGWQQLAKMPKFFQGQSGNKKKTGDFEAYRLYETVSVPVNDELVAGVVNKFMHTRPEDMNIRHLEGSVYDSVGNCLKLGASEIEPFDEGCHKALHDMVNADAEKIGKSLREARVFTDQPGWEVYKSWNISGTEKIEPEDLTQRLYISVPGGDVHKVAGLMYEKLRETGNPFYFKVNDEVNNRAGKIDNIVAYTSAELLEDTVNALDGIGDEHPELVKRCREPAMIYGKINDWMGYASEVENGVGGRRSYTQIVGEAFFKGMGEAIDFWCRQNANYTVNGESVLDYLTEGKDALKGDGAMKADKRLELVRRMQYFLSEIPKVDKGFKRSVKESIVDNVERAGLDSHNLCVTPLARSQINNVAKYWE